MNANIAQWQCTGLPSRGRRFESAYSLKTPLWPSGRRHRICNPVVFYTRWFESD